MPQPGGPYSSTPRGGWIPRRANDSGCASGQSTDSVSACLVSTMSPTSSSDIAGTSTVDRLAVLAVTTSSAPSRSAWPMVAVARSRWRSAARTAASRRSASRSAVTKPGVRAAISPSCTSSASGTGRSSPVSSASRCPRSGSGTPISLSSRAGRRSSGSTASRLTAVQTSAIPSVAAARATSSRTIPASGAAAAPGGPAAAGASASRSSSSSTAGLAATASASAADSTPAAAAGASPSRSAGSRRTTLASTAAATARTSVLLPAPSGPVMSTPRAATEPSRASSGPW